MLHNIDSTNFSLLFAADCQANHTNIKQTNLEIVVCLDLAPNRRPHQMTLVANQILFLLNFFRPQKATDSPFLLCGFDPVKKIKIHRYIFFILVSIQE